MDDVTGSAGAQSAPATQAQQVRLCVAAEASGLTPLSLVVQGTGVALPVTRADVIVGRHSQADIRLPLPDVSRRHCKLTHAEGKWSILDLDSLNGVYVNGARVKQAQLSHRDVITVGAYALEVDMRSHTPTVLLPMTASARPALREAA